MWWEWVSVDRQKPLALDCGDGELEREALGVVAEAEAVGGFDHEVGPWAPGGVRELFEGGDGEARADECGDGLAEGGGLPEPQFWTR